MTDHEAAASVANAAAEPEAKQHTTRLKSIQVARAVAALSVVAFHARSIQHKYLGGHDILPSFFGRGMVGVDLFFVISGFVMVLTTRGRHGKPREVGRFIWNRAFRIYPTYWFYYLLLLPVFLFIPGLINASMGNRVDMFASFFLLPSDLLPLLLVAWSLTLELWFYVVFAVLLFLSERALPLALAVWFVVLVTFNWFGPVSANPFLKLPLNAMAIEFVFGAVAALLFRKVGVALAIILAVAGLAMIVTLGVAIPMDFVADPGLPRPLALGLGFAMLLLAITAFDSRKGIGPTGRVTFIGDMSYSIYLSHVLVLTAMRRLWMPATSSLTMNFPLVIGFWVLSLAAVLTFGWLSYQLVERPILKLSARWRNRVFRDSNEHRRRRREVLSPTL